MATTVSCVVSLHCYCIYLSVWGAIHATDLGHSEDSSWRNKLAAALHMCGSSFTASLRINSSNCDLLLLCELDCLAKLETITGHQRVALQLLPTVPQSVSHEEVREMWTSWTLGNSSHFHLQGGLAGFHNSGRSRQENHKFKPSLGNLQRRCLKIFKKGRGYSSVQRPQVQAK